MTTMAVALDRNLCLAYYSSKFNPMERFRGVQHQLNYVNGTHRFSKYPLLRAVIEGGKENKNCIYCVVSVHLYSASNRTHSAEALPVRETQREGSNLLEQIDQAIGSPVKKRDGGCKLKEETQQRVSVTVCQYLEGNGWSRPTFNLAKSVALVNRRSSQPYVTESLV